MGMLGPKKALGVVKYALIIMGDPLNSMMSKQAPTLANKLQAKTPKLKGAVVEVHAVCEDDGARTLRRRTLRRRTLRMWSF